MGRYVKSDIVDKVLLRDLPSLYGIKDVQELNRFFTYIAYNTGNEFSYEKMCRDSGIQKTTLKKYLEYLEAAFLIKVLNRSEERVGKECRSRWSPYHLKKNIVLFGRTE